jgi:hypothetical protein
MIEADVRARRCCRYRLAWCARPTGGSHGRTTDDPAQYLKGAKLRAAPDRSKGAARGIIEAGAPAFGCTVHPLRLQAPRAAYAHKSPGQGDCTATPGWPAGRDGTKSTKSKIIDTTATDSAIVGNMPHFFRTASPARNASNERAGTPRRISRPDRDQDRLALERATSG